MTITTTDNVQTHVANGESLFPIFFPFAAATDIRASVVLTGGRLEVSFIVTPAGDAPAGVLFQTPPPKGSVVRIWRETSPLQEQAWRAGIEYPARVHEAAHDRRAMVDIDLRRDLAEGLSRTLRTPEPVPELPADAARAGRVLGFDSFGQPTLGPRWNELGGGAGPSGGEPLTSLTVAMHADWQPIYGAEGPDQLEITFRVFDEQRRSFPEIRDADVLGDEIHRAGSGSGEIEFFRSKGLPEGATDQPGDEYPWGLTVVFNGYLERTGIGFGHLGVLRGNHSISGRWVEYNPLASGFEHHEAMFGPSCYYRRRGNMVWVYVGQEAGGVGGQVSDTTIEWLDDELTRMTGCHIHFWTHHPILGCSPTPPDDVLAPVVEISAAAAAAIAAGEEPEIVVGEYWDPSEISTQLFLGEVETGVFLEHEVDFEYVPYVEAPEDAPEEIGDGGNYAPPEGEIGPSAWYKIRILRSWSRAPLVAGDTLQLRTVPVPTRTMDAWTSHLLIGTEAEPGLLLRHRDKIRVSAYGHTGDLADPTHRSWFVEPRTGIPMFNNNMAINGRVDQGFRRGGPLFGLDNPLVYTIAHYDALARRATFRRWNSTARVDEAGDFHGAWLMETHPHLDCDLTIAYPHYVDLGDGAIFDSRRHMTQHVKARKILIQRDVAEAAPRRTLTDEIGPNGFRKTQPGVGGAQEIFVADLGDRNGRDSKIDDAVEFSFKTPTGRSPGRGFYFRRNASRRTLKMGVRRSRDSEHLAKGEWYVKGEGPDSVWRDILRANAETGFASAPQGFDTPVLSAVRPLSLGDSGGGVQIVTGGYYIEGGRDLAAGEGVALGLGAQFTADAAPRWLATLETRKISSSDEDPRHDLALTYSPDGSGLREDVWRVTPDRIQLHYYPLAFATPEAAAATRAALGVASAPEVEALRESPALSPLLSAPLAQRHLGDLGEGWRKWRVPQGLCHVVTPLGPRYFAQILVEAVGSPAVEKFRISEFVCNPDLTVGDHVADSPDLILGHQVLTALWRDGAVQLYTALRVYEGEALADRGKGLCRIRWRGAATTQADVAEIRLFGLTASDHPQARYHGACAAVSKDGKSLLMSAYRTIQAGGTTDRGETIFRYDLAEVEALAAANSGDATAAMPLAVMRPAYPPSFDGTVLQGLACDGRVIVRALAYVNALGREFVQILSMDGQVLREFSVEAAKARYTPAQLRGADPALGVPNQIELEGVDFVGNDRLVLLSAVTWRVPDIVVTRSGRRWAAVQASTGVDPLLLTGAWAETILPATHGAWSSATAYPAPGSGGLRVSEKHVYAVEALTGAPGQEPLDAGRAYPVPSSDVPMGSGPVSASVAVGRDYQVTQYDSSLDRHRPLMRLSGGSVLFLHDARHDSDATRPASVFTERRAEMSALCLRAERALSQGSGVTLHASDDPTLPGVVRLSAHRTVSGAAQNLAADLLGDGKFVPGGAHPDQAIGRSDRRWPVGYFGRLDVTDAAATRVNLGAASAADVTDLQVALAAALLRIEALETP